MEVLLLLNRNSPRSQKALTRLEDEKKKADSNTKLVPVACDLMSFASVRKAAKEVNEICKEWGGLNVLANNAGVFLYPDERTVDGYEVQMQTNHLSHFLLTKLVFPSFDLALKNGKEVRICQHSSAARHMGSNDQDEKFFNMKEKGSLGGDASQQKMERYHQSKLANMTFALGLHKKLIERGYDVSKIKSVVAEPGLATTDIQSKAIAVQPFFTRLLYNVLIPMDMLFANSQSAADGCLPLVHASFAEEVLSGDFFLPEKDQIGKPFRSISEGKLAGGKQKAEESSLSEENQQICWRKSEEACGDFFELAAQK